MEKQIEIYQIDAFTNKSFEGNPAGVSFGDNLTDSEMQKIAKEMNLAETAFLSKSPNADYNLRWFTPAVEVELCGHATIASLHFLKEKKLLENNTEIKFETRSGILNCKVENGFYFMQIPVFSMKEFDGNKEEVINALNINKNSLDNNVPFIIAENGYLYIYLKNLTDLHNLQPDFKELKNITKIKNEFNCVAVFTLETVDKESFAHSRFFAPYYGIDEDPVTGSANGPFILVLNKLNFIKNPGNEITLIFEQGDVLSRRGRVKVRYNQTNNELNISGQAVTVLKGALTFNL
ncbi:MAG: PhzF family phenazine biosynthesis protein [Ignavibacteriaceae bacterium]